MNNANSGHAVQLTAHGRLAEGERRALLAASVGTILELYDFFLVGALASEMSNVFFSGLNATAAYIFTLLGFAAGFALRPFGALVFGRIGDLIGRKRTFLITILVMGLCTFVIGLLPGFAAIGIAAPILFISMRLLQGLALGGEFSGAVIYVAEHAPTRSRGAWTSWIILTSVLGLLLSFIAVLPLRVFLGKAEFAAWGWRIPYLLSIVLLGVSIWVRLKLQESPEFLRMKAHGLLSKAPVAETFGQWRNLKLVLLAFFAIVSGQTVVWYTGQLYAMFFLAKVLRVDDATVNFLVISATVLTAPLYLFFGWLSDRIGRKPIFLAGVLLGAVCYIPLFQMMSHFANPALERAQAGAPIVVIADMKKCSFQFNPTGTARFSSSCDVVKGSLAKAGLDYTVQQNDANGPTLVRIGERSIIGYDGGSPDAPAQKKRFESELSDALQAQGYRVGPADASTMNKPVLLVLLIVLLSFGTMTFVSSSTMLVELFPSRIRYTAMSFPYHLGSAIFGGFLPAAAFAIVAATGQSFAGLWFPVTVAAFAFVLTLFFVKETRGKSIADDPTNRAIS